MGFSRIRDVCFTIVGLSLLICCPSDASPLCGRGPLVFVKGESRKLDCHFAAPVRVVYWYKNNKLITNGTGGLYQSYDQLAGSLRSTLHFPTVRMDHEANYTCKADTSHTTRCPNGQTIDIFVLCGRGHITAGRKMVSAEKYTNTSLRCSALSWKTCFIGPVTLTWHYRNRILQNSTKYTIIEEQKTNECQRRLLQAEFILKISNVTDEDSGEYFCQLYCNFMKRIEKAAIKLVAVVQPDNSTINVLHV